MYLIKDHDEGVYFVFPDFKRNDDPNTDDYPNFLSFVELSSKKGVKGVIIDKGVDQPIFITSMKRYPLAVTLKKKIMPERGKGYQAKSTKYPSHMVAQEGTTFYGKIKKVVNNGFAFYYSEKEDDDDFYFFVDVICSQICHNTFFDQRLWMNMPFFIVDLDTFGEERLEELERPFFESRQVS